MKLINNLQYVDRGLVLIVAALASVGVVMMSSASIDFSAQKYGDPFFHISRQLIFLMIAILASVTTSVSLSGSSCGAS